MNKHAAIAVILCLVMAVSVILAPTAFAHPPPIKRPMNFLDCTIQGESPQTVDYSWAYDTASCQIIMNTMDTLMVFSGEHMDQFLPSIATSWTLTTLPPMITTDPIGGLWFEDNISGTTYDPALGMFVGNPGATATYYYAYNFTIRTGVFFQPPYNYSLTPADVAYSFQRTLIQDRFGGPQWMLYKPLLDNPSGADQAISGLADLASLAQVSEVGALIRDSVQVSGNVVTFYLMYPYSYNAFYQVLCQTWSSIESKQWINNQVIVGAGRPDWNGGWSSLTAWLAYHNPTVSPLDSPTPMEYSSGPFCLTTLDYVDNFWEATRYEGYWRGWPANFPVCYGSSPAGFVDTIDVTWNYPWATRKAMFLAGDCDFCAVPREAIPELYTNSTPPYNPPNYPLPGIDCIYPLPELALDAFFFTFDINPATLYGPIGPANAFFNAGIPSDFFGNANWGIHVRKAFAQAFDYTTFIAAAYLGEAIHPATAIIPGLTYYDPTVAGYSYNLAAATSEFKLAGPDKNGNMLWNVGFTLTLVCNTGNDERMKACNLLSTAIMSLNPLFHINVVAVDWATFLTQGVAHDLPCFISGWQADFPDPHDFAFAFYHSDGTYPHWQVYNNPAMDSLVDAGLRTPDGSSRSAIYHNIQVLAVSDVPSFPIDQPIGRFFERDWVVDWYYNPAYGASVSADTEEGLDIYFYPLWKWYYAPQCFYDVPTLPYSDQLPYDCNYDGKVNMMDIAAIARCFGSIYGPPIGPRWNFRCDLNKDRKIDMKDIGMAAKQFGKTNPPWPILITILTASPGSYHAGTPITITESSITVNPPYTMSIISNMINEWQVSQWPGPLVQDMTQTGTTYTFTPTSPGTYYIEKDIIYTVTLPPTPTSNVTWTTSIVENITVVVT